MGAGLELYARHRDGRELPIDVNLSPLHTEVGTMVSASIRDITERKHAEAIARLLSDRLASAVESVQDGFALFDREDHLVLCNSVYRRLVADVVPGPLIGRPYEEIVRAWSAQLALPDEASRAQFIQDRLRQRHEPTSTFEVRTEDGRSLRVSDRRTADGGIVKTIWDVTDDERRAEELREARQAADSASAAKSEFLSSMSHELRTPLNAILGFAQLLQRNKGDPLPERQKERVAQILKGGEHLLRLIDDILDLARIEAGRVSVSVEPVNVMDVVQEVVRTLDPMATGRGLSLEVAPPPEGLPTISADQTRFAQVLMNFVSNAVKYNRSPGVVTVTVSTPRPRYVRIAVRDTGFGIPAAQQDKLFQPFQRAGQEVGPIEGTGIGLVITKRLAELMGGNVGFQSTEGKGSEFWVDMPAHASRAVSTWRPPRRAPPTALASPGVKIVLYVEDNAANVEFMRDLVGSIPSVQLLAAPTAEMGIELARMKCPGAIIMDINLPRMSGVDALRALRTYPETCDIPVIALSAAASEREKQVGLRAGFFRYMTKPVNVEEFLAALEDAFRGSLDGGLPVPPAVDR